MEGDGQPQKESNVFMEKKGTDQSTETNELTLPEKLCQFYVERPKLAFGVTLSIQLSTALATVIMHLLGYNVLPYDFKTVPLNLEEDATKLRADAFKFANRDSRIDLLPTIVRGQQERSLKYSPIELFFCKKSENILTSENLVEIDKVEKQLYSNSIYQSKACHLDYSNGNCSRLLSIIRLFDGTYRILNSELYDPQFKSINNVLRIANNISVTRAIVSFSLDIHTVINKQNVRAKCIRSVVFNGFPLRSFKHTQDRKEKQTKVLNKYVKDAFAESLAKMYKNKVRGMDFYYNNLALFLDAIDEQVTYDLLLAAGSLLFIFCFIWINTGSLWITGWALLGILTNFFGANLVYRTLLDYRYIGTFHVLSVFIILGIGADDVFVFFNTWKLMEERKYPNLTIHLTETFRSAASSMFATSLTTMAAFLASAGSPLLAVSSFGVFSGILVLVNYISVCIFFPSVVVTYHYFWQNLKASCKKSTKVNQETHEEESPAQNFIEFIKPIGELFKCVVNWFEGPYIEYVILHPIHRWVVMAFFLIASTVFIAFATQLQTAEEQVQVWQAGTNWYDVRDLRIKNFRESGDSSNVIRIYLVWGLQLQDRRSCHFTDFKCKGTTVFDEDFDLNPPACQIALLNFCKKLKSLSNKEVEKLKIRRSIATGELEVSCFLDKMESFFISQSIEKTFPGNANISLPIDEGKARALMKALPSVYNETLVTAEYRRFFEVGLGFWMSERGNPRPGYQYFLYGNWMGGSIDPTAKSSLSKPLTRVRAMAQGGRFGNRLRYAAVVVNTSLTGETLKYQEGIKVYQNWEDFIKIETAKMPRECKKAFQCTPEWNNWHWLKVQRVLLIGAIQGIFIGLCLALPVLIFTTRNWIIGLLAALTIALITNAVVGLIPLIGWRLGVMESLNLTLVVGLSVDYCVHLADGYIHSNKVKRVDRMREMLRTVGVSIVSGACTTLGASMFMLGSQIMFFYQFGIFMFCTIGFSILFALAFFPIIVSMIGPEGDRGSLKRCFSCILQRRERSAEKSAPSASKYLDEQSVSSKNVENKESENEYDTPMIKYKGSKF